MAQPGGDVLSVNLQNLPTKWTSAYLLASTLLAGSLVSEVRAAAESLADKQKTKPGRLVITLPSVLVLMVSVIWRLSLA